MFQHPLQNYMKLFFAKKSGKKIWEINHEQYEKSMATMQFLAG